MSPEGLRYYVNSSSKGERSFRRFRLIWFVGVRTENKKQLFLLDVPKTQNFSQLTKLLG